MDRYTKTVLTVIAGCLLMLVGVQADFPPKAHAVSTSSIGGDKAGGTNRYRQWNGLPHDYQSRYHL